MTEKLYVVELVRKAKVVVLARDAAEAKKIGGALYDDDGFMSYEETIVDHAGEVTVKALDDARLMRKIGGDIPYDRCDLEDDAPDSPGAPRPNPYELTVERLLRRAAGLETSVVDTSGFRETVDLFGGQ